MEILSAVFLPVVIAFVALLFQPFQNKVAKKRALDRVEGEPLYYEGAHVSAVYDPVGGAFIMQGGRILSIGFGRMVIQSNEGPKLPLTVQEAEALHIFIDREPGERAPDGTTMTRGLDGA